MMKDDMHKYKELYLSEAHSHVKDMDLTLLQWEKHPSHKKYLHDIFRAAHTLKSISAAMGYQQAARLCHAIEDLLDAIRNKTIKFTDCVDLLFNCLDFLVKTLKALTDEQPELDSEPYIQRIQQVLTDDHHQHTDEVNVTPAASIEKMTTIDVKVERLDKLLNLTEQLLVNKMKLETLSQSIQNPQLITTVEMVNRIMNELQYHVMQIRLVPIGFVFNRFNRMVRDLAKLQKKEVELQIEGGDIELDRSLIDGIAESLAHLIKNAIDHGLETPKIRQDAKKKSLGKVTLSATREKESFFIEVRDDGAGLDLDALKNKAIQRNLLTASATKEEVMNTLFTGISTSKEVTAISGRGLGLDIVKRSIASINGTVDVISEKGMGTIFTIKIPITLAVIVVLLLKQVNYTYAIPITSIERLITVLPQDIKGVLNHEEIIYNHTNIPILRLSTLFNMESAFNNNRSSIVILRKNKKTLGLIVDYLLTTEEIVTKPINKIAKENKLFSGTALLGSGETILILDVDQLFLTTPDVKKKNVVLENNVDT